MANKFLQKIAEKMRDENLKGIRTDLKHHEVRDEKWEEGINSKLKKIVNMEKKEHSGEKKAVIEKRSKD